jgi:hypothetical protein
MSGDFMLLWQNVKEHFLLEEWRLLGCYTVWFL